MRRIIKIERNKFYTFLLEIDSGDEEWPGCTLNFANWIFYIQLALPPILWPSRTKHKNNWTTAEDIQRLGRDWYYEIDRRVIGLSVHEGFLNVRYGRQTHDSDTTKSWGWFIPWANWRFHRFSLYDLSGNHFWTLLESDRHKGGSRYDKQREAESLCPKEQYLFRDFDGEEITATTRIEEREWRFGEGWFKWLGLFRSPKIRRALDISFSAEVGPKKGSWKGGIIGTGIDMKAGELCESAFKRFCIESGIIFIKKIDA